MLSLAMGTPSLPFREPKNADSKDEARNHLQTPSYHTRSCVREQEDSTNKCIRLTNTERGEAINVRAPPLDEELDQDTPCDGL